NAVAGTGARPGHGFAGGELHGGGHWLYSGPGEGLLLSRAILGRADPERLGDGVGSMAGGADPLRSRVPARVGTSSSTRTPQCILTTSIWHARGAQPPRPGGRRWPIR